jgi:hypothetical protein
LVQVEAAVIPSTAAVRPDTAWAYDVIDFVEDRRPGVVALATLASVAVRIEPHLLRRLRLELLPDTDVGVEADLWFSPLVESRGADAIVLYPAIARELWSQLAVHPRRDEAIRITADAHAEAASALVLEERLTALAITDGEAVLPAVETLLEPAIAAVREGGDRALEVARWLHRASGRLHDVLLCSERLRMLLAVSAILLGRHRLTPEAPSTLDNLSPEQLAIASGLLPPSMLAKTITVGIAFDGEHLVFLDAADADARHTLTLPDTTPRLLAVSWGEGASARHEMIEPAVGSALPFDRFQPTIVLTTLANDVYELALEQELRGDAELYARLLYVLNVPAIQFLTVLSAPLRNLLTVLSAAAARARSSR